MAIEGLNLDIYQFFILLIGVILTVLSPFVVFLIRQKSSVEKLQTQRESDRKDYEEHIKHSELEKELLNKISEVVSVQKYMLERIEQDIQELKRKIGNGYYNNNRKSPV